MNANSRPRRLLPRRGCAGSLAVPALCRPAALAAALTLCGVWSSAAVAAVSGWTGGPEVRARLIATFDRGVPRAALELALAPGWKTYWRSPGEAGIPPSFDFSGSANLAASSVRFPLPHRVDDGTTVSNVYSGTVVLPLDLRAADAGRPLDLAVRMNIGVCAQICIPVNLETALRVAPDAADASAASRIAAAEGALPKPAEPGRFAVTALRRTGGSDEAPAFELEARVPAGPVEVFVEGPADWFPSVPEPVSRNGDTAVFRFTVDRLGARTPLAGGRLTVTLAAGAAAVEQSLALDGVAALR